MYLNPLISYSSYQALKREPGRPRRTDLPVVVLVSWQSARRVCSPRTCTSVQGVIVFNQCFLHGGVSVWWPGNPSSEGETAIPLGKIMYGGERLVKHHITYVEGLWADYYKWEV